LGLYCRFVAMHAQAETYTGLPAATSSTGNMDSPRSSLKAFSQSHGTTAGVDTLPVGHRSQAGFERRVAWLEEDVALLHRRLRDERGEGAGANNGGNDSNGLRMITARVDDELEKERQTRELLEARVERLEDRITKEKRERELQLNSFSTELETVMRSLIDRIDMGLSSSTASALQAAGIGAFDRTDDTEARLRTLIKRVDEGLSAGALALQDQLVGAAEPLNLGRDRVKAGAAHDEPDEAPTESNSDQLIASWDRLRQENRVLREHQQKHMRARSPVAVGSHASPVFTAARTSTVVGVGAVGPGTGRCIVTPQHCFSQPGVVVPQGGPPSTVTIGSHMLAPGGRRSCDQIRGHSPTRPRV